MTRIAGSQPTDDATLAGGGATIVYQQVAGQQSPWARGHDLFGFRSRAGSAALSMDVTVDGTTDLYGLFAVGVSHV